MSKSEVSLFDSAEFSIPLSERLAAVRRARARTVAENTRLNMVEVPLIADKAVQLGSIALKPAELIGSEGEPPEAA